MLVNLHVKNIALIDDVEIDFTKGFNVLTGETGAGKSLIIDSVNFALGGKVPKDIVREDAEYALCELTFVVDEATVNALEELGVVMEDNQVVMQRRIVKGRGTAKVNGETVSSSLQKEIASLLIDIHGQHEHQSLLYKKKHLEILDNYCRDELSELKRELKEIYILYCEKSNELKKLMDNGSSRERESSFIKYEIDEIIGANLIDGEDEELEGQYRRMNNSKNLSEVIAAVHLMSGYDSQDSLGSLAGRSLSKLKTVESYDEELSELISIMTDIDSLINDFNRALAEYEQNLVFSQKDYNEVEQRLDVINRIKNKYGQTIGMVMEVLSKKQEELAVFEHYDEYVEKLNLELDELMTKVMALCQDISSIRKLAALKLSKDIENALKDLNFLDAGFSVSVNSGKEYLSQNGFDDVEFLLSTNPGERMKSISEVASGGELSRIMLALKTVLAKKDTINTLIFDEIDTGISGRTAQKVSEKIAELSRSHQVICITHLAQIAAMGDSNYYIEKSVNKNRTVTSVNKLDGDEIVNELARMLSGAEVTNAVINSAKEMKELANGLKADY